MIMLVVILLLLFSPIFSALPSAFEEDRSGNDLDELEAMLSGEHRGSSYGTGEAKAYSSSPSSSSPQQVQAFLGPIYDPPYKNAFQNDTYFGSFIQQLYGATIPGVDQAWSEIFLNGTLYLNISGKKAEKKSSHFIKPILIEEPDF